VSSDAALRIGGKATTEIRQQRLPSETGQLQLRSVKHDRVRSLFRSHLHLASPRGASRTGRIALAAMSASLACHRTRLKLIVITRVCTLLPFQAVSMVLTILGVGGWLIPRDNSDRNSSAIIDNDYDTPAVNSSRIPDATPTTFRRRSFGASSSGINSPEILNTPSLPRYSTSTALSRQSGSPQSYFNNGAAGRSTTSISSRRNSKSRRNSRATRTDGSTDERT
jgi:hypothetical protein